MCEDMRVNAMEGCIREFTADTLDDCASLFVSVFNQAPWNDSWTLESARKRLSEVFSTPNSMGFVFYEYKISGFILGHCEQGPDGKEFHLAEMCVRSDRQRQGIGSGLLAHLEEELNQMAINSIYLITARDGQAEAFYARNGYRVNSRMIVMVHRF